MHWCIGDSSLCTEVKPFSADGTWRETSWESRSLPEQKTSYVNNLNIRCFFISSHKHVIASAYLYRCNSIFQVPEKDKLKYTSNILTNIQKS